MCSVFRSKIHLAKPVQRCNGSTVCVHPRPSVVEFVTACHTTNRNAIVSSGETLSWRAWEAKHSVTLCNTFLFPALARHPDTRRPSTLTPAGGEKNQFRLATPPGRSFNPHPPNQPSREPKR